MIEKPQPIDVAAIDRKRLARVCRRYHLGLLVLFGSHAQGRAAPRSDVDIAFLTERRRRPDPFRLYVDLVPIIGSDKLDVVDLRKAPPLLRWNVARCGMPLYASGECAWPLFAVRAMKEWDDVRKFERFRLEALDRRLERWK